MSPDPDECGDVGAACTLLYASSIERPSAIGRRRVIPPGLLSVNTARVVNKWSCVDMRYRHLDPRVRRVAWQGGACDQKSSGENGTSDADAPWKLEFASIALRM